MVDLSEDNFPDSTNFDVTILFSVNRLNKFSSHFSENAISEFTKIIISAEAQPYNYKLPPGIWKEVMFYLEMLVMGRKSLSNEKISNEELNQLITLEKKLELLTKGGSLSKPKKFDEIN